MKKVKIQLEDGAIAPSYATEHSAGLDLVVHSINKVFKGNKELPLTKKLLNSLKNGYIFLRPFERVLVSSGIRSIELPEGYQMEIRSRSGVALKTGLIVSNQPGTIDSDYRGPIKIILYNSTPYLNKVLVGMRVAQAVITPYVKADFEVVEEILTTTERGEGGFGSTDK